MRNAAAIREIARAARMRWCEKLGIDSATGFICPLNHELLRQLVRAHGLSLVTDKRLQDDVLGKYDPKRLKIKIHPSVHPLDLTFVIAHELGHHCLQHDADISPVDTGMTLDQEANVAALDSSGTLDGLYRVYSDRDRQELEANVFATELLAPGEAIARAVADDPDWSVKRLADDYGLRPIAIEARLAAVLLDGAWDPPTLSAASQYVSSLQTSKTREVKPVRRDTRQIQAAGPGPALVLAGPGSGKTSVLVNRYIGLIQSGEADLSEVLALTFTNKAAEEMRERILAGIHNFSNQPTRTGSQEEADTSVRLGNQDERTGEFDMQVQVTTLHAFALDLITRYVSEQGKRPPSLITGADALLFLASLHDQLPLGAFEDLGDPHSALSDVMDAIGLLQERNCTPRELLRFARQECCPEGSRREPSTGKDRWREDVRMRCWRSLAAIYRRYQRFYRQKNYVDFTTLLHQAAELLEQSGGNLFHHRWRYILVDEYQDMNRPCARLLRALAGGREEVIWAVGDPRQSIYRFRGATPEDNLATFRKDFPTATPVALTTNYRSHPDIVALGHALGQSIGLPTILQDDAPLREALAESGMTAARSASELIGASVVYGVLENEAEELEFIASAIRQLHQENNVPLEQMAVLCRTKRQATAVATALEACALPTTWAGALEDETGFRELMCVLLLACDDPVGLEMIAPLFGIGPKDISVIRRISVTRPDEDKHPTGPLQALRIAVAGGADPEGAILSAQGREPAQALLELVDGLSRAAYLSGASGQRATSGAWRVLASYLFSLSLDVRQILRQYVQEALISTMSEREATSPRPLSEHRRRVAWSQMVGLARSFPARASAILLATNSDGGFRNPVSAFLDFVGVCRRHSRLEVNDEVSGTARRAVQVMTIHRSKGLEWPIVFVPNLTKMRFKVQRSRGVKLPTELEHEHEREERCIFYVAITRACDRVFLTRAVQYGVSTNRHSPLAFLEDIKAALPTPVTTFSQLNHLL